MISTLFRMLGVIQMGCFIVVAALPAAQFGDGWTQFRGPNGSGVAPGETPPVTFGQQQNLKWKIAFPPGNSSPVVWEDKLFLTAYEDNRLQTVCVNRVDGAILWSQTAPAEKIERHHPDNSPASSTPAVDESGVYVYFGSYGLLCYDHEGNEQWRHPVPTPMNMHGTATSPMVYRDWVYLMHDSMNGDSYLLALNKTNGEPAWKTSRTVFNPNWSSPVIWHQEEGDQLVMLGGGMLKAYDPATGREIWRIQGFGAPIPIPIVGEEYLYASTVSATDVDMKVSAFTWDYYEKFDQNQDGRVERNEIPVKDLMVLDPDLPDQTIPTREMVVWTDRNDDKAMSREEFQQFADTILMNVRSSIQAIRPGGQGDITETHVVWKYERSIPYMPSCLYIDGRIYMAKDGGVVTCLDAREGKEIYRKRVGRGNYSSSPVSANGYIYISSQEGIVTVFKTGEKPEVVATNKIGERIQTTPAIFDHTLYLRTGNHLYAFAKE